MKAMNMIILLAAIVLVAIVAIIGFATPTTSNNTTNDTINITLNATNNTTENQTHATTRKTKTKNKSDSPEIVSDSLEYNYQADDGSYYRQVEYSDGNFRQIDTNGKIIGSSYSSDHVEGPGME